MCKFNQIVAQIAAALLDRISLPERMDTASHCDMRPLPWQVRSLCPYREEDQRRVAFTQDCQDAHLIWPQGYVSHPSLCHNINCNDLGHLDTEHHVGSLFNTNMLIRF